MSDYDKLTKRIRKLITIKDYSFGLKEAGAILETLFKDLHTELLKGLSTNRKEAVLAIEKEIGHGNSTESLAFGQLIEFLKRQSYLMICWRNSRRGFNISRPKI